MRIAVAMSGGVDSSVAALLLKEAGHEVDRPLDAALGPLAANRPDRPVLHARRPRRMPAGWPGRSGIRHYVLNLEEEFRRDVVRPFVGVVSRGRDADSRARPATRRSSSRRSGSARAPSAARPWRPATTPRRARRRTAVPVLRKGIDPAKDQSYFLYDLTAEQLAAARFPVGELTKAEVRAQARRANLPTADKEESQEICFVPPGTRAGEFVAATRAGPRPDASAAGPGRARGRRAARVSAPTQGHFRYTIGQRRGIGVAATERLYVLAVDAAANRVVVGPGPGPGDARGARRRGAASLRPRPRREPFRAGVRIRHRAPEVPATVTPGRDGTARVDFDVPGPRRRARAVLRVLRRRRRAGRGSDSKRSGSTSTADSASSSACRVDFRHRHLEVGADLPVAALVELDVLLQGAEELLGVIRRREHAGQHLDVGPAGHRAPEVEDELGRIVEDVREVDVVPLARSLRRS